MCPSAHRIVSWRRLSTVLRQASNRSSRGCRIVRQRSSRQCWRSLALSRCIASTCWTRDVERDCAARSSRRLRGVDLSEGMLAHAKDKNVYHALINAELTDYLRDHSEAFDLIVSADALVYFGDLTGVIAAFAGALRPNGLVVFTLEQAAEDSMRVDYRLELHGRYSHGQAYVERLLTFSGLQSKIVQAELRMEAGAPVPGLVIRAAKPVSAHARPLVQGPST